MPYGILFPLILLFCVIGVWSEAGNVADLVVLLGFGLLGYLMKKLDFEPAPLVLARAGSYGRGGTAPVTTALAREPGHLRYAPTRVGPTSGGGLPALYTSEPVCAGYRIRRMGGTSNWPPFAPRSEYPGEVRELSPATRRLCPARRARRVRQPGCPRSRARPRHGRSRPGAAGATP